MPDWTAGENAWRERHYGESRYDDALAPDHGLSPTCEACETELADLEVRGQLLCVGCADDRSQVTRASARGPQDVRATINRSSRT